MFISENFIEKEIVFTYYSFHETQESVQRNAHQGETGKREGDADRDRDIFIISCYRNCCTFSSFCFTNDVIVWCSRFQFSMGGCAAHCAHMLYVCVILE